MDIELTSYDIWQQEKYGNVIQEMKDELEEDYIEPATAYENFIFLQENGEIDE